MSFTLKPLRNGIGLECRGLDLDKPIPQATRDALYNAWIDAGIIVFKDTAHNPEQQIELSRCFGSLDVHPVKNLNTESQYPELMVLASDAQSKLSVYYWEDKPLDLVVGFIPWHSDLIFTTTPSHGAMLRSVENPRTGGHTAWIDTMAAYEALSDNTKTRIEHLEVEYRFCTSLLDARYGLDPKLRMKHKGERSFPAFPPVAHPLVWRHPVSSRKVLNLSPLHLQRIVGLDDEESDALLKELVTHVTSLRFSYEHAWEQHDMVLWDNWRTLHTALGFPLGEQRLVHRTSLGGSAVMGRVIADNSTAS